MLLDDICYLLRIAAALPGAWLVATATILNQRRSSCKGWCVFSLLRCSCNLTYQIWILLSVNFHHFLDDFRFNTCGNFTFSINYSHLAAFCQFKAERKRMRVLSRLCSLIPMLTNHISLARLFGSVLHGPLVKITCRSSTFNINYSPSN